MISFDNFWIELNGRPLFNPINCSVPSGKIIWLQGPSGVGKSSLLTQLSTPSRLRRVFLGMRLVGQVHIEQPAIMMQQNFAQAVQPWNTLGDYWLSVAKEIKNYWDADLFEDSVQKLFGQSSSFVLSRPMHEWSGGALNRVGFAFVSSFAVPTLLFDEPFVGQDLQSENALIKILLDRMQDPRAKNIILTGHHLALAGSEKNLVSIHLQRSELLEC